MLIAALKHEGKGQLVMKEGTGLVQTPHSSYVLSLSTRERVLDSSYLVISGAQPLPVIQYN